MKLKDINRIGQKVNKITYAISNINALNEARKGNTGSIKRKVKNKIKNRIFRGIKL